MRGGPISHGLEGWRRLTRHYQPAAESRTVGLLQNLSTPNFRADKASEWENDRLQWEADRLVYEAEADLPLDDDVEVAIVLSRAPSSISSYLQMQAGTFKNDYLRLHNSLSTYLEATWRWDGQGSKTLMARTNELGGLADMDVSSVACGKGKGKSRVKRKGKTKSFACAFCFARAF